jgi:hypothetical protein
MLSLKSHPIFMFLFVAFYSSTQASETCSLVSTEEVSAAFAPKTVEFLHADPSGMCSWMVESSGSFSVQVLVQPSVDDAKTLYDTFASSHKEQYAKKIEHKAIGQVSSLRMSGPDAPNYTAALLILNKDRVVNISYYPRSQADLNEHTAGALQKIGLFASGNANKADQQYGQCEWFPESQLDNLLGKKNRKVQRLGPNHCIAYAQPGNASLSVMTDKNSTSFSFANEKEGLIKACQTVALPEYGNETYAFYDCENPGNQVMSVEFFEHGVHLKLGYGPAGRASTPDDLEKMKPLIKHVYKLMTER